MSYFWRATRSRWCQVTDLNASQLLPPPWVSIKQGFVRSPIISASINFHHHLHLPCHHVRKFGDGHLHKLDKSCAASAKEGWRGGNFVWPDTEENRIEREIGFGPSPLIIVHYWFCFVRKEVSPCQPLKPAGWDFRFSRLKNSNSWSLCSAAEPLKS